MKMAYESVTDFHISWSVDEYNQAMAMLSFAENCESIRKRCQCSDSDVRVVKKHLLNETVIKKEHVLSRLNGDDLRTSKVLQMCLELDDFEIISNLKARVEESVDYVDFSRYPVDRFGQPYIKYVQKDYAAELFDKWAVKYKCRKGETSS